MKREEQRSKKSKMKKKPDERKRNHEHKRKKRNDTMIVYKFQRNRQPKEEQQLKGKMVKYTPQKKCLMGQFANQVGLS